MKPLPGSSAVRARGRAAFTLIELLAVMAIILILAGLIINIAGSAQYNSARARATGEVNAMSTALESYKTDNGTYPTDSYASEQLDAQKIYDPTTTTVPTYINSSEFLYQALSGFPVTVSNDPNNNTTSSSVSKAYMAFKPDQLHLAPNATGNVTSPSPTSAFMYIIDPFGFSYGYSTIYAATVAANTASGSTQPVSAGYNPTFDLWSTAGYATGGKGTPSSTPPGVTTTAGVYSTLWVKNW